MPCHLIRPDGNQIYDDGLPSIFLAGPIQGSPTWDEKLISALWDLNINIFDPRRTSMEGFEYEMQVAWETEHLVNADVISFSFVAPECDVPGRSYAQTSRFELGECLARVLYGKTEQKVIVYTDANYPDTSSGFPGATYFRYKVEHEYADYAKIFDNWDEYLIFLREKLLQKNVGRQK